MHYVSINRHRIRSNTKAGTNYPPIRIAKSKSGSARYANEVEIIGNSRLIYSKYKPILKCEARVVLVAENVRVIR